MEIDFSPVVVELQSINMELKLIAVMIILIFMYKWVMRVFSKRKGLDV